MKVPIFAVTMLVGALICSACGGGQSLSGGVFKAELFAKPGSSDSTGNMKVAQDLCQRIFGSPASVGEAFSISKVMFDGASQLDAQMNCEYASSASKSILRLYLAPTLDDPNNPSGTVVQASSEELDAHVTTDGVDLWAVGSSLDPSVTAAMYVKFLTEASKNITP